MNETFNYFQCSSLRRSQRVSTDDFSESKLTLLNLEEGEDFWQPGAASGYVRGFKRDILVQIWLRVPGGVQHGVWTHLYAFWIIRESINITMLKPYICWNFTSIDRHCHCSDDSAKIVKATNGGQHEMWKLAFRPPPPGGLKVVQREVFKRPENSFLLRFRYESP